MMEPVEEKYSKTRRRNISSQSQTNKQFEEKEIIDPKKFHDRDEKFLKKS